MFKFIKKLLSTIFRKRGKSSTDDDHHDNNHGDVDNDDKPKQTFNIIKCRIVEIK